MMFKGRIRLTLLILYVVVIFATSSIPSLTPPGPRFLMKDKLAHVCEYFLLGVLLFQAIGWEVSRSRLVTFGFILAVGVSIGALDEIYQSYIPNRMMSIKDWYADVIGVALGVGIFVLAGAGRRPMPRFPASELESDE